MHPDPRNESPGTPGYQDMQQQLAELHARRRAGG